jgi:hypothetical protein
MSDTQRFIGKAVMSDTPRTDSAMHGFLQLNPRNIDIDIWEISCVDVDFARELERENEVLRQALIGCIRMLEPEPAGVLRGMNDVNCRIKWYDAKKPILDAAYSALGGKI